MTVAPRAWKRRAATIASSAALVLAVAACARRPAPVPLPPTPPRAIPGYDAPADSLASVDASGLAGRRIALDPGHGGYFRGALGVHGLAESEVNLGVALRLRELLAASGAEVFLTRDRDRDFLTPADSSLRADLAERVRLANTFAPDLFLSIHHNADPGGAHNINETQTYYKLGDDGPSLDVAQDVHRALVRNVGIRPHKVVPGNYFVLRGSDAPALLTETSYITNPDVEERLRLPHKQQLEADAMFIGLARYFARPLPRIARFSAEDPSVPGEDSVFVRGNPRLVAVVRGGFDEFELVVDGTRREALRRDSMLVLPPDGTWPGGGHEATLRVRRNGSGSARPRTLRFAKVARVERLEAAVVSERLTPECPIGAVRIVLREASGGPHVDTLPRRVERVTVRRVLGRGILPRDTVLFARDGVAWGYFRLVPGFSPRTVRFRAEAGGEDPVARIEFAFGADTAGGPWTGFARRMPEDAGLADVPATREPDPAVSWLNRDGFARIERDPGGRPFLPPLPGFRVWGETDSLPPRRVPLAGGALLGRRVTLDPEGGGEDGAGVGPSGSRAAHLNLETARILARFLAAAGAEVHLTREGDVAFTEVQRVRGSEAFGAERYLRIGHRLRRFGYYYASAAGRRWAERAATTCSTLGVPAPAPAEDPAYSLQQTSCPALYASPARVDSAADEDALLAPGALRAEAYALFIALAREWTPDAEWALDSLDVRDAQGRAVPGALVTLGGALVLESDALGRVRFFRTEPGPLEALVDDPRVRAKRVLLDSMRGAILTGPLGG